MAIYYLDPNDEPKDCGQCDAGVYAPEGGGGWHEVCQFCNGTGQLGDPEGTRVQITERREWNWALCGMPPKDEFTPQGGPYPTEAEALAAAREAYQRRNASHTRRYKA